MAETRRETLSKIEQLGQLIAEKQTEAEKKPLREVLSHLKSGAARQTEIAELLVSIAREVSLLKSCKG